MINSHLAAAAIATNEEGEILLVKEGKDHIKGSWNFPGGSFEDDESMEECARREVLEETGREVKIGDAIGVYLEESVRTGNTVAVFLFEAEIIEQKHEGLDNGEILDTEFFTPEEVKDLDLRKENRRKMLKDFTEGRKFSSSRVIDTRD